MAAALPAMVAVGLWMFSDEVMVTVIMFPMVALVVSALFDAILTTVNVGVFASITIVLPLDDAVADTLPATSVSVIPVASGFVASGCDSMTVYVPVYR